jgi:hypothetical protein
MLFGMELPMWLRWMFCENYYAWFHILGGGWVMWLMVRFTSLRPPVAFLVLFALTLVWELYEYLNEGITPYVTQERWMWDTLGDVVGAMLAAIPFLFKQSKP